MKIRATSRNLWTLLEIWNIQGSCCTQIVDSWIRLFLYISWLWIYVWSLTQYLQWNNVNCTLVYRNKFEHRWWHYLYLIAWDQTWYVYEREDSIRKHDLDLPIPCEKNYLIISLRQYHNHCSSDSLLRWLSNLWIACPFLIQHCNS